MESRKILKSIKIKPTKAPMISPVDLLSAMKAIAKKEEKSQKGDRKEDQHSGTVRATDRAESAES